MPLVCCIPTPTHTTCISMFCLPLEVNILCVFLAEYHTPLSRSIAEPARVLQNSGKQIGSQSISSRLYIRPNISLGHWTNGEVPEPQPRKVVTTSFIFSVTNSSGLSFIICRRVSKTSADSQKGSLIVFQDCRFSSSLSSKIPIYLILKPNIHHVIRMI